MDVHEQQQYELEIRRRVQGFMPNTRLRIADAFAVEWRQNETRGRWFLLANGETVARFTSPENAVIDALGRDTSLTLADVRA